MKTHRRINFLDTTLRDGIQSEEISLSLNDKLNIVRILDGFGVEYIEAGYPSSGPGDTEFFKEVKKLRLKNAKLCAFGSTKRKNIPIEEDTAIAALLAADTDAVTVFGKSSALHVNEVLRITPEENLALIRETVEYLKKRNKLVIFDAEHFYDGFKEDASYAESVLDTVIAAGADVVCLCDTNGGAMPAALYEITQKVVSARPGTEFGIHAHDDGGCAAANTMLAVAAGATHVQGTFIGYGERCGNAALCTVIPNIALKTDMGRGRDLTGLTAAAAEIAEYSNLKPDARSPYVGKSAFAHKAGMHADGVLKNPATFEHIDPGLVGNKRRLLLSGVSGRGAVMEKIRAYAPGLLKTSPELDAILAKLKEMEGLGYHFEAADASFELLAKRILGRHKSYFSLVFYKTEDTYADGGERRASAVIKIEVDGRTETAASDGQGPVNALDLALRKALTAIYPVIGEMYLSDYKVRVLEHGADTAARVRVLIESTDRTSVWTTVGVSNDIIEASLIALIDSLEYKLAKTPLKAPF